jgi:hypothetical protein
MGTSWSWWRGHNRGGRSSVVVLGGVSREGAADGSRRQIDSRRHRGRRTATLLLGVGLFGSGSIFMTSCAITPAASPEQQRQVQVRAQQCLRAHPEVERYEVDRFGAVTAWYRMGGGNTATGMTQPFFDCVYRR